MSVLTFKSEEMKTFPAFLRDYANYTAVIKGNSEKTVCEYLLDLRTFFRFMKFRDRGEYPETSEMEKTSISDLTIQAANRITSENILDFLMHAGQERKNNTSTRMRKLSALRSFYNYAYGKKHLVDSNPTTDIDSPKQRSSLPKHLTVQEAVNLLEAVKNDTESKTVIRDYAIICLFLNTGMRLSELVGLDLKSFDSDLITVKVIGKGNKERIIYLNDAARDAIKDYIKVRLDPKFIRTSDKAFFLSGRQARISNKTVQWIIYKYLDKAGLGERGLSAHKLRHTAATLMYQTGKVDIRVLKEILGHKQLNTTQIYTHVVDRNIEEAMSKNPLADLKIKAKPRKSSFDED